MGEALRQIKATHHEDAIAKAKAQLDAIAQRRAARTAAAKVKDCGAVETDPPSSTAATAPPSGAGSPGLNNPGTPALFWSRHAINRMPYLKAATMLNGRRVEYQISYEKFDDGERWFFAWRDGVGLDRHVHARIETAKQACEEDAARRAAS